MRILTPSRIFTDELWNEMDQVFADLNRAQSLFDERQLPSSLDFEENEDHYRISVDLPGIRKEDLKLEIRDQLLSITGDRKRTSSRDQKEIVQSRFSRTFTLPRSVDTDRIEAHHENGALELYLPKHQKAQVRRIEIQDQKGGLFEKLLGTKKDSSKLAEGALNSAARQS